MLLNFPKELIYVTAFGSVALFIAVIAEVVNSSWKRYEEEVLKGAAMSFDQIYLNIPPQQLLTVAAVLFLVVTGFRTLVFGSIGYEPTEYRPCSQLEVISGGHDNRVSASFSRIGVVISDVVGEYHEAKRFPA